MDCIDVYYSPKQVSCLDSSSLSPRKLMNSVRGRQRDVADSLPWTCGSLLSAAHGVLNHDRVRVLEIHRNTMLACVAEYVQTS